MGGVGRGLMRSDAGISACSEAVPEVAPDDVQLSIRRLPMLSDCVTEFVNPWPPVAVWKRCHPLTAARRCRLNGSQHS